MRNRVHFAVATTALLALGTFVAATGALDDAFSCPGDAYVVVHAHRSQDDGGRGADAGDCRDLAMPLGEAGVHWGFLDMAGPGPGAGSDLEDWYALDLAALEGLGSPLAVNVTADVGAYLGLPLLPHVPLRLDVFRPGASSPVVAADSCGPGAEFTVDQPGVWHFRIARTTAAPCIATSPPPPDVAAPTGQDYLIYNGCHPVCIR